MPMVIVGWSAVQRVEHLCAGAWPSTSLPKLPPTGSGGSHLKRPHIKRVVVAERRTGTSAQFRFELVSYPAGVKVSLECLSAPVDGHRTQRVVGQFLLCDHEQILPALWAHFALVTRSLARAIR